jgi:hypothetical protein
MKCSSHITRLTVDLDDELDLQCKNCMVSIAPLHSVDYYMKPLKTVEKLSGSFLVLSKRIFHNICVVQEEMSLCEQ